MVGDCKDGPIFPLRETIQLGYRIPSFHQEIEEVARWVQPLFQNGNFELQWFLLKRFPELC